MVGMTSGRGGAGFDADAERALRPANARVSAVPGTIFCVEGFAPIEKELR